MRTDEEIIAEENMKLVASALLEIIEYMMEYSVPDGRFLMRGDTEMNPCNCGDWIRVTDQYPDKEFYDWVLVSMVTVEDETFRLVPEVAEWREDHWATVDTDDLEREMFVRVTHWTRLPDNPK